MNRISLKSRFITRVISVIPFCLSFALISNQSAQALTIVPTSDGNTLAETLNGSGITIDLSSINFVGAEDSSGTFTDGLASGLGIDSGIILTTGQALDAVGEDGLRSNTSRNFPGTANKNPSQGSDISSLKFNFKSTGGDIFLKYVFASEEYSDDLSIAPANLLDTVNFFLDGENISLVPDTNIPVSAATVNGNNYPEFYNDNEYTNSGSPFNIEYEGFTDVFTAKFSGLTSDYHTLELVIADGGGDNNFDSAVFIAAGSLTAAENNPTTVPEPTSILSLLGMILLGSTTANKAKKS